MLYSCAPVDEAAFMEEILAYTKSKVRTKCILYTSTLMQNRKLEKTRRPTKARPASHNYYQVRIGTIGTFPFERSSCLTMSFWRKCTPNRTQGPTAGMDRCGAEASMTSIPEKALVKLLQHEWFEFNIAILLFKTGGCGWTSGWPSMWGLSKRNKSVETM